MNTDQHVLNIRLSSLLFSELKYAAPDSETEHIDMDKINEHFTLYSQRTEAHPQYAHTLLENAVEYLNTFSTQELTALKNANLIIPDSILFDTKSFCGNYMQKVKKALQTLDKTSIEELVRKEKDNLDKSMKILIAYASIYEIEKLIPELPKIEAVKSVLEERKK